MLIVYDSQTGNVERFVQKLNMRNVKISETLTIDEPFILVTYTIGFGEISESTKKFMDKYSHLCKGVASSGNKIWGDNFAKAGEVLAKQHEIPLLLQFELSGLNSDVSRFKERIEESVKVD